MFTTRYDLLIQIKVAVDSTQLFKVSLASCRWQLVSDDHLFARHLFYCCLLQYLIWQGTIYVETNLMFQVIICQPHAEKKMQWRAMQECGRIKRKKWRCWNVYLMIKSCDIWRFHYLPYIMSWWFTLCHSSFCFYWHISPLFGKPNTIQYQIQMISDCSVRF